MDKKNSNDKESYFNNLFGKEIKIIDSIEEVLERNVVSVGNGAHITIPKKHTGKTARVFILRKEKQEGKEEKKE